MARATDRRKIAAALRLIADALDIEDATPPAVVWIDQTTSPLGRRRHCATVRRRLEQGLPGASIVGRDHRLTQEALSEELAAVSREHVTTRVEPEPVSVTDELELELRAVGAR